MLFADCCATRPSLRALQMLAGHGPCVFSSEAMAQAVTGVYDELIRRDARETVQDPLEAVQPRASV